MARGPGVCVMRCANPAGCQVVDLENVLANYQALSPFRLNPGESIVVVRNLAAFTSRYGNLIRVAGEFSGSLNNSGDHLTLLGPVGEPILDFDYDPAWYPLTDGGGYSLVAVDPGAPTGNWGQAQNWRPSTQPARPMDAGSEPACPRQQSMGGDLEPVDQSSRLLPLAVTGRPVHTGRMVPIRTGTEVGCQNREEGVN